MKARRKQNRRQKAVVAAMSSWSSLVTALLVLAILSERGTAAAAGQAPRHVDAAVGNYQESTLEIPTPDLIRQQARFSSTDKQGNRLVAKRPRQKEQRRTTRRRTRGKEGSNDVKRQEDEQQQKQRPDRVSSRLYGGSSRPAVPTASPRLFDVVTTTDALSDTSSTSTTLPWCSDILTISTLPDSSLTTLPIPLPTDTASSLSNINDTSDTLLSSSSSATTTNTTTTTGLYTSTSAGEPFCLAISSSIVISPSSRLGGTGGDGNGRSAADASPSNGDGGSDPSVRTIVVSASTTAAPASTATRSTVTVTAIMTDTVASPGEGEGGASSDAVTVERVGITSTLIVYSTTTQLDTIYTTVTPRPTAAFLTS